MKSLDSRGPENRLAHFVTTFFRALKQQVFLITSCPCVLSLQTLSNLGTSGFDQEHSSLGRR